MLQKEGKKKVKKPMPPLLIFFSIARVELCARFKIKRKEKKILIPLERRLVQNENKKIACEHARTWSTDVSKQSQREILDQEDTSIWIFFYFKKKIFGVKCLLKSIIFFLGNN